MKIEPIFTSQKELEKIDSTDTVLDLAKKQASALIKSGLKDSFVVVKSNEILIMNTKDINTATKVYRMNNAGNVTIVK